MNKETISTLSSIGLNIVEGGNSILDNYWQSQCYPENSLFYTNCGCTVGGGHSYKHTNCGAERLIYGFCGGGAQQNC